MFIARFFKASLLKKNWTFIFKSLGAKEGWKKCQKNVFLNSIQMRKEIANFFYSREAEDNENEFVSLSPVLAEPEAQIYMQKARLTSEEDTEELFQYYFQKR